MFGLSEVSRTYCSLGVAKRNPGFAFKQRGFTLIEVLIVIFIISIVTSVALLSLHHNSKKHLETFANDLTQKVTLAQEQAMLQPAVLSLTVTDNSYYFASLQPAVGNKKESWLPLEDRILGKQAIPDDIEVNIEVMGSHNARIIISTSGDITPFKIHVGKKGEAPLYSIIGDANGSVTNKSLP